MTEESEKEILDSLLPLSYELNEIFYGEGLKAGDASANNYATVDSEEYKTVEDIINKASEVFSSEYVSSIKSSSVFTGDEELGINPRYLMINGVLKKNVNYPVFNGFSGINGKIDTSTVKIKKQNSHTALLEVSYIDGGTTEITLVLENGKWLINSPTY